MTGTHVAPVPEVLVEKSDGIAVVTLNRPDRLNALNASIMTQLLYCDQ